MNNVNSTYHLTSNPTFINTKVMGYQCLNINYLYLFLICSISNLSYTDFTKQTCVGSHQIIDLRIQRFWHHKSLINFHKFHSDTFSSVCNYNKDRTLCIVKDVSYSQWKRKYYLSNSSPFCSFVYPRRVLSYYHIWY